MSSMPTRSISNFTHQHRRFLFQALSRPEVSDRNQHDLQVVCRWFRRKFHEELAPGALAAFLAQASERISKAKAVKIDLKDEHDTKRRIVVFVRRHPHHFRR